jgi:hypothetical protein
MLGTEDVAEDCFAVGAEVIPPAAVLAEQVLAELVGRGLFRRLALKLLGDCVSHEIGEPNASRVEPGSEVGLELIRQADRNRHGARLDLYYRYVIHSGLCGPAQDSNDFYRHNTSPPSMMESFPPDRPADERANPWAEGRAA